MGGLWNVCGVARETHFRHWSSHVTNPSDLYAAFYSVAPSVGRSMHFSHWYASRHQITCSRHMHPTNMRHGTRTHGHAGLTHRSSGLHALATVASSPASAYQLSCSSHATALRISSCVFAYSTASTGPNFDRGNIRMSGRPTTFPSGSAPQHRESMLT